MFGIGGSEIVVILIVALLFLGPEKLPDAARTISKGIRDLRRSTRDLQHTIENDTQLGGALRDIKSALRGEDQKPQRLPPRPPPVKPEPPVAELATATAAAPLVEPPPPITVPAIAGESDDDGDAEPDDAALASQLIRPAAGAISKASGPSDEDPQG